MKRTNFYYFFFTIKKMNFDEKEIIFDHINDKEITRIISKDFNFDENDTFEVYPDIFTNIDINIKYNYTNEFKKREKEEISYQNNKIKELNSFKLDDEIISFI